MARISIDRSDKVRVVLTELLPYEVPMLFSNEGFYSLIKANKYDAFFSRILSLSGALGTGNKKYGIPFNYEVRKTIEGDTRVLSIIHPYCQYNFIELYERYDALMLHLCSRSPFTLRKIHKVARSYYSTEVIRLENPNRDAELELDPESLSSETKYLKSYFTYYPIDLIYKFYERHEFQRLEQRFNFMLEFDISKCFYHIYTHSIGWAIKDKETSKRNALTDSFENTFDTLMQKANYNETNGIVVGPEVSRIFAEIILQKVDVNVLQKLEGEHNYKFGVDFEIRRYVDDYFVFSNDEKLLHKIQTVFKKELEYYKLYLNPNKSTFKTAPFVTDISVGKRELNSLLMVLYEGLVEKIESANENDELEIVSAIKNIRNPYSISRNFIKDFQCIVKRNRLTYDNLSKDVVRFFNRKVTSILQSDTITNDPNFEKLLLTILDIVFYAYSLNINSNTTFKLAQIIVQISSFYNDRQFESKENIYQKIWKDIDFVLTNFHRKSKRNETDIETLNILIALKRLGSEYFFSSKKLLELFGIIKNEDYDKLNYFQIITFLYYIDKQSQYNSIRESIERSVMKRFENELDPFSKSEITLLFFDYICCPYVSDQSKRKVINFSKYAKKNEVVATLIQDIVDVGHWFMNWDEDIDLEKVLKKKEWGSSY
jgi:hypothetical protein